MSFKETIHAYLLKISLTHNKKQIIYLSLLINCISATWERQELSLKDEHNFCFSNFLMIELWNASAKSKKYLFTGTTSELISIPF